MPLQENSRFINLFNAGRPITYQENLIQQLPGIIQYLPLNELSGVAATDASGNGHNGTYSGVTLNSIDGPGPSMGRAGRWDGVNDVVSSASFPTPTTEGTLSLWMQQNSAAAAKLAFECRVDANNRFGLYSVTSSQMNGFYYAGGVSKETGGNPPSMTTWFHMALAWSLSNNRMRVFINGSQVGSTQTSLGTWAGASATLVVGALATLTFFWNGYLQHSIVSNQEWTAAQIALAAVAF